MYRLTTLLSDDTQRKMAHISVVLGLNKKRYSRDVIERAVDLLYQSIIQETQPGKPEGQTAGFSLLPKDSH